MDGVKFKRRLVYVTLLCSVLAIFYVFQIHLSTNKKPADTNLFLRSHSNDAVDHGCYWFQSVSDQTPIAKELLVQRHCNKTFPDVIIAGVMKCGTTALKNFLKFHPQLAFADHEPHFFDKKYHLGMEWYLEQMPYSTPEQITLEKTPKYFVHPPAPHEIIKVLGANTKIIFIVGDPVRRAISHFTHDQAVKAQALQKLETNEQGQIRTMGEHLVRGKIKHSKIKDTFEETVLFSNGSINTDRLMIDIGIYIKHLRRWLAAFSRDQILILDGEEYIDNPLPVLQKVEKFLHLQHYFTEDNFYFDQEKGFFCMARPIQSCMRKAKGRIHPSVKIDVKQKLYDFYEPYNMEFANLWGQNFTWIGHTTGTTDST